jgi:hypothetical protein
MDDLISHLKKFVDGYDRSVDWAKVAESLIDEIGDIEESLEDFRHDLAFYRLGGGDHLLDEIAMQTRCEAGLACCRLHWLLW